MDSTEMNLSAEWLERFWQQVDKSGNCWLWLGGKNRDGYGRMKYGNKVLAAHRLAYILTNGPILDNVVLCHQCDTRNCVRPDHMVPGSHQDNVTDRVMKRRSAFGDRNGSRTHPERRPRGDNNPSRLHPERLARGIKNHNAKLTDDKVRQARLRFAQGGASKLQLAREYGVNHKTMARALLGEGWAHVH